MIDVLTFNGEFFYPDYKKVQNFNDIKEKVQDGITILKKIDKLELLELIQLYSRELFRNPITQSIEGIAFLSNWLRKSNIIKIIEKNFHSIDYLIKFVGNKKKIKAQPKGIVCHWIAGNVPTLGLFSLFQSIIVGNGNILRIPPGSHEIMLKLLEVFRVLKTDSGLSGNEILKSIAIIYYDKSNYSANSELSNLADVRVVWGGESAVNAIIDIPKSIHCEDIVFGPKYSFAVFDRDSIQSEKFERNIKLLIADVYLFDQSACTSPHVVFLEKSKRSIEDILKIFETEFRNLSKKYPKIEIDQFITSKIINIRSQYALDINKNVICPKENDWTILINNEISLEEPIESRTLFVKEIDSIYQIIPLITRKIQTIGHSIFDKKKLLEFSNEVTYSGVSRIVKIGQMHFYDSPWDGMLYMSRLVNWASLYDD